MIHAAAIRHEGKVFTLPQPARHVDVALLIYKEDEKNFAIDRALKGAGFITDKGDFLDRGQAYRHAVECGQRPDDGMMGGELYSEMVW